MLRPILVLLAMVFAVAAAAEEPKPAIGDSGRAAAEAALRAHENQTRFQLHGIARLQIDKTFPDAFAIHQILVEGGRSPNNIDLVSHSGQLNEFVVKVGLDVPPDQFRTLMRAILKHGKISCIAILDDPTWDPKASGQSRNGWSIQRHTVSVLRAMQDDRPISQEELHRLLDESLSAADFWALANRQPVGQEDREFAIAQSILDRNDKGSFWRAEQILRKLIDREPRKVRSHIELARLLIKSVGPQEDLGTSEGLGRADLTLHQALQINAEDPDLHVLLGYVRIEQGRLDEALAELNKARALGTTNRWLHYNLGLAHEFRRDLAAARRHFEQTVNYQLTGPDDRSRFPMMAAYERLIPVLIRQGDLAAADRAYQDRASRLAKAEEAGISPCEEGYLVFRLQHFGDHDQALRRIDAMRDLQCVVSPGLVALAQFLKGEALRAQGDQAAAKEWLGKARINIKNPTQFLYAVAQGEKTSKHLRQAGEQLLPLNTRDSSGNTVLGLAVIVRDLVVVKRLLGAGMSVNESVAPGEATALMVAAAMGELNLVKALVGAGATVSLRDSRGHTALDYAQGQGHTEVAAYLKSNQNKT